MIVKEHFTTRNYAQMAGVWYDIFNHFIDLQDTCRPHIDEDGNEWFYVKFEKFLFINIVKTLYEKLNTRNSRHLVKELHEQLKPAEIRKNKFCIAKVDKLLCLTDSYITEYERNIIFGALYYVLYKQQDILVEPSVVEKVKQQALYPGNPYPHYVNYFVNKLSEEPQVEESEHPTEESSKLIVELNLSKEEKRELYKEIKAYKLWIEKEVTHIRELIKEGRLHAKYLTDYGVAQECIKECAILLCKDSDVINSEVVQAKSGICIDNIREFIYRNFPTCHEKYKDSYTYKLDFTQHAQQAEAVEDVTTPQPTEEPVVETTDTDVDQPVINTPEEADDESLKLQRREQALALILSCEEYLIEGATNIITAAFKKLCEKRLNELDAFLSAQSYITTVCRMIGIVKEQKLLTTTVNQTIASQIAKKNNLKNAKTIASYIGKTKNTPQKDLLKKWREYLHENMQK